MTASQQHRSVPTAEASTTAPPLPFAPVAENAFRIFGVPASASRGEVQNAAGSIRRAARLGMAKQTDWDLAWLGPLDRTEAALQNAIGRLADVERRLTDRLFWFGQNAAAQVKRAPDAPPPQLGAAASPEERHDTALLMLLHACVADPLFTDTARWSVTIAAWQHAVADDAYWNALLAQDQAGGFEPAANVDDIVMLRRRAATLAVAPLADVGKADAAGGDGAVAGRILQSLRAAAVDNRIFVELENQILGPLEEEIIRKCKAITSECWPKIVREPNSGDKNKPICAAATQQLETEVVPKLGRIERIAGKESLFAQRSRGELALALSSLAASWTWADNFIKSEELYKRAHLLAVGTPAEGRIKEDVKVIKNPAQRQRDNVKPIKRAPTLRTVNGIGTHLYSLGTKYPPQPELQYATLYFVVMFIPLIPLRRYLVKPGPGGSWYFHATIRFGAVQWIHLLFVLMFALVFILGPH
jgi:hypothetical protein